MCMLCVEIEKQKMTTQEILSAYKEMEVPEGHQDELAEKIKEHINNQDVR